MPFCPLSPADGDGCRPAEIGENDMASKPSGEDIQDRKAKECQRSAAPPVPEGWVGVHERRTEIQGRPSGTRDLYVGGYQASPGPCVTGHLQHVSGAPSRSPHAMVSAQLSTTFFNSLFPLHSNAQRPSAITGMTRQEIVEGMKRRRLGDVKRAVIVVREHKTGLSRNSFRVGHTILTSPQFSLTGRKESALLVADATAIRMTLLWMKVQDHVWPNSTLAFPDFEGNNLPTPTAFRKELEIRNKRQEGPMKEAVSRALSHSLATAQQYYQAPTMSDTYVAYGAMQEIIGGTRASSPPAAAGVQQEKGKASARAEEEEEEGVLEEEIDTMLTGGEEKTGAKGKRKRCHREEEEEAPLSKKPTTPSVTPSPRRRTAFTQHQQDLLADYFAQNISDRKFPTSLECQDFIKLYPAFTGRKPKDIYDKCRNLAGR